MKKAFIFTLLAAAVFLNACSTTPVCVTSSVTPLQGRVISENLGKTEGRDTAWSILGWPVGYMIGRPDLDLAIRRAVENKSGDTLINVRCYETWGWFVLLSINTVRVEGEAVKLAAPETGTKDKKK